MIHRVADQGVGRHRAAEVAEQTGEAGGGAGRFLRRQLQGLQADQHHRAVDQEADHDQRGHVDRRVAGRVQPVDQGADGHQDHEHHAGGAAIALEQLVRQPAAEQGAGNPRPFVEEVRPGRLVDVEVLGLLEVGRRPVEHTVAQQVDEHVGQGDVPEQLVAQHVGDEDLLGRQLALVVFVVAFGVVVLVLLDRRQAAGLRGVAHGEIGEYGYAHGDDGRHVEGRAPVAEQRQAEQEQRADQAAADVVGDVPHRDHAAALLLRPPVDHGPSARRPAHALGPAVDEEQDEHDGDAGGSPVRESENEHHRRRHQQAERQEDPWVGTIRDQAHDEFRQAVGDGDGRHRDAQLTAAVAVLDEVGHGQGEVLAQQVVTRVADEDTGEDLPAQAPVGAVHLGIGQWRLVWRGTKDSEHRELRLLLCRAFLRGCEHYIFRK